MKVKKIIKNLNKLRTDIDYNIENSILLMNVFKRDYIHSKNIKKIIDSEDLNIIDKLLLINVFIETYSVKNIEKAAYNKLSSILYNTLSSEDIIDYFMEKKGHR